MSRHELSRAVIKRLNELGVTAEDTLRKALGMIPEGFITIDGTVFPEGTVFVSWFKDAAVSAIVRDGKLMIKNKSFKSLSAAAAHYTGRQTTNGWGFWNVKLPGKEENYVIASTLGPKT